MHFKGTNYSNLYTYYIQTNYFKALVKKFYNFNLIIVLFYKKVPIHSNIFLYVILEN